MYILKLKQTSTVDESILSSTDWRGFAIYAPPKNLW